MDRITDVKIISKFISPMDNKTYGIYETKFNGEKEFFVQNGDSIGVISHLMGESVNKCLLLVKKDVAEELNIAIDKLNEDKSPEIVLKATGKEIFNFLACESNKIAAYFNVDEEDLTFSQILDYYDSHKEITYALRK